MDTPSVRSGSSSREDDFYRKATTPVVFSSDFRKIDTRDRLYFAGSCFALNLHDYWSEHFLPCASAPFGNIYNPRSLKDCFSLLCSGGAVGKEELFLQGDLWRHSLFSTSTTDTEADRLLDKINTDLAEHRRIISESDCLILTLGTAFIYEEKTTGRTVNNCHKRPSSDFSRRSLRVDEIAADLKSLRETVRGLMPGLRMIISLSPVRHLRDRAEENSLSKALLRCGIDLFLQEEAGALYFPSSEIMLDELRDYRWYADDLVHPSKTAVNYIMDRFCSSLGSEELNLYLKDAEKLKQLMEHRLLFPGTGEGRKFMEYRERETAGFREKYPFARI